MIRWSEVQKLNIVDTLLHDGKLYDGISIRLAQDENIPAAELARGAVTLGARSSKLQAEIILETDVATGKLRSGIYLSLEQFEKRPVTAVQVE